MSKLLNALITLTVLSITLIIFLPTLQAATVDFSIKGVKVLEENDVYVTVHSNIVYRGKLDVTAIIPGARIKTVSEQLAFTNKRAIDVKVFSLSDYPKFTGFKTVKFYVDKANKVKEACETNNGYAKSIKFPIVVPGGVDLLVTRVVPSSSCLKIILRNNGKQKFRGEVKIGISIDDTKKKDIVTKCILGPKAEKAIKYSHRLKPGRTVLKLDVDKDNKIAEGDEKNNKFKAELYPAKDLVKLDRYVAVGKPGTNSRKIQSGKELGMIQITKDMVILDKKQGIAWLQVDTAARNLGSLAKGKYSITVATMYEDKSHFGTKQVFSSVPKPGEMHRHSMKCKIKFVKHELLKLRITLGRPDAKGTWFVRDTIDIPIRFWKF